jgi:hypothetical protein
VTQALDPVLLVSRNLPRQGQPAIKSQMRNGHEERLTDVLSPKIEFADDPTLVARIVDPGDLAPRRQIKVRRLLLHLGQQGGRRRCRERQGRFELGDEQLNLEGIVDHEQPFRPGWIGAG